ncbi:MAG: TetR/AcrR family transcriptional regulator [Micrococcales bacterium]
MKKQQRAQTTISSVIEATSDAMRSGGESAVRIQEISAKTGVSIGSIYHHFGDRNGLIREALVYQFASNARADIQRVQNWISNIHSTKDLRDNYDRMVLFLNQHFENQSALERASIMGTMVARPELREALGKVQHELTESLAEAMQVLKERGMLKEFITPKTAATIMSGMLFGKVIAELDSEPVSDEDWNRAMLAALSGLIDYGK